MGLLFVDCSLWGRTHVMIYNFIVPVSWFNLSNSIILEQFLDLTGILEFLTIGLWLYR
jgi:hypothetical protein